MKTKDIWQEFSVKIVAASEVRPEGDGWLTADDVSKRFKKSRAGTYKFLEKHSGLMERFRGLVMGPNGKIVCCVWYRPLTAPRVAGMEPARRRPGRSP